MPVHDHYFRVLQCSVLAERVVHAAIIYGNVLQMSETSVARWWCVNGLKLVYSDCPNFSRFPPARRTLCFGCLSSLSVVNKVDNTNINVHSVFASSSSTLITKRVYYVTLWMPWKFSCIQIIFSAYSYLYNAIQTRTDINIIVRVWFRTFFVTLPFIVFRLRRLNSFLQKLNVNTCSLNAVIN